MHSMPLTVHVLTEWHERLAGQNRHPDQSSDKPIPCQQPWAQFHPSTQPVTHLFSSPPPSPSPLESVLPSNSLTLSSGSSHTCALRGNNLTCWGQYAYQAPLANPGPQ